MARLADFAPAKPFPPKKRHFRMFRKEYLEKWPFIKEDESGDTCIKSEVHSRAVK